MEANTEYYYIYSTVQKLSYPSIFVTQKIHSYFVSYQFFTYTVFLTVEDNFSACLVGLNLGFTAYIFFSVQFLQL